MTGYALPAAVLPLPRRLSADAARLGLFAVLFALALVPVATTPIPAMVDYVNHLARMYELTAPTSPYYQAAWKLYPNLAMDLIVPILARWTGVEAAGRLFLLAAQILVVTGAIAIEIRVKRRFEVSGFVALLFLFNAPFAWGFLNFEFAMGVALWGVAAWLAMRDAAWPARFVVNAVVVLALFVGHLFALGLYGAALLLHEAWAARGDRAMRRLLGSALLLAAPVAALAGLMLMTGGSVGASVNEWQAIGKPLWPIYLLNGDSTIVSAAGSIVVGCLVYMMARRRELAFVGSGAWLALGFGALYLLLPGHFLDTEFADVRVLVGAVLVLPAFLTVRFASARSARIAAVVVCAATIANVVVVERVWWSYQPAYRDMIASFARLTPQARVLVGTDRDLGDPPFGHLDVYPFYHAPTLAVHYAGAFVPTLFTSVGKQPLTVRLDMRHLSFSDGGPLPISFLAAVAKGSVGAATPAFVRHWPQDFDYLYVLEDAAGEAIPGLLQLVDKRPGFALYRIREAGTRP